jgi:hypothetical protein
MSSISRSDPQRVFIAVESSFHNIFKKQRGIHISKFTKLRSHHYKVSSYPGNGSKKFIFNLSKHTLTDHEDSVLTKGLNFAVMNPHFNLDIA